MKHWWLPIFLLAPLLLIVPSIEDRVEASFLVFMVVLLAGASALLSLLHSALLPRRVTFGVLLLLLVLGLSVLFSPVKNTSLLVFLRWIGVLLVFVASVLISNQARRGHRLLKILLLGGLMTTLASFYLFSTDTKPLDLRYLSGVFYSSNYLGGYLLLFAPLSLSFLLAAGNRRETLIYLCLTVLFTSALVLTRARASWGALLIGFLFLTLVWFVSSSRRLNSSPTNWWRRSLLVLLGVWLLVSLLGSERALFGRLRSITQLSIPSVAAQSQVGMTVDTGLMHRVSLWRNSWRMWQDHPFWGVGLGNFGRFYYHYQDQAWIYGSDPHNQYLSFLTETGVVGLVGLAVFLSMVFLYLGQSIIATCRDPAGHPVELGILAVILSFSAHMLVENSFNLFSTQIGFFGLLGILVSFCGRNDAAKSDLSYLLVPVSLLAILFSYLYLMGVVGFQKAQQALLDNDSARMSHYFQRSLNLNPYQPYVYESLGVNALRAKNYSLAITFLETSLSYDNTISEVYGELAVAYYGAGYANKAEKTLQLTIDKSPLATPRYYNALANFYLVQKDEAKALATYELAIQRFPLNDVWVTYQHLFKGMNDEIVETYTAAASLYEKRGELARSQELRKTLQESFSRIKS